MCPSPSKDSMDVKIIKGIWILHPKRFSLIDPFPPSKGKEVCHHKAPFSNWDQYMIHAMFVDEGADAIVNILFIVSDSSNF